MKYVPGPEFGQFSGSQGNTTASRNRFGTYVRNRVQPVDPSTSKQMAVRNQIQEESQAWRGLTDEERAGWVAAAATLPKSDSLGQTYFQTGLQLFTSVNLTRFLFAQARVAEAPAFEAPGLLSTIVLTAEHTVDALSVAFTATPVGANNRLIIEATAAVSAGISFVPRSGYKAVAYTALNQASPVNILAAWEAIFGSIASKEGNKIFVRARIVNQAYLQGANISTSAIVVAAP